MKEKGNLQMTEKYLASISFKGSLDWTTLDGTDSFVTARILFSTIDSPR